MHIYCEIITTIKLINIPSPYIVSFLCAYVGRINKIQCSRSDASGKEPACQCSRHMFDPWVRKSPWNRRWQPAPVFLLENPTDICAWQTTVHGATESQTQRETEQAPMLLTMQCIISSELTQFTMESLDPLTHIYPLSTPYCRVTTEILFDPMSLTLLQNPHISEIIQYLFSQVWLISLSIMSSRLTKTVGFPSLLQLNIC